MNAPVAPGDVIAGKYRVERVLAAGGMGVVVAATHLQLDELVAIKFMLPHVLEDTDAVARFMREARAAARIKSDHVVRVLDVATLEGGVPYIAMEYLDGMSLDAAIQAAGRLPVDEALDYVLQTCDAMADAHVVGIVHRDLKPANLHLTRRSDGSNFVKVLDFGISKLSPKSVADASDASVTKTSALMGSPLYMSPEQMRSARTADARADIWALGCVLYEALSGACPFEGETMPEICARILADPPPSLSSFSLPPGLEAVIGRCLAKLPQDRFQTVGELAMALRPFAPQRTQHLADRAARVFAASQTGSVLVASQTGSGLAATTAGLAVPKVSAATVSTFTATGGRTTTAKVPVASISMGVAVALAAVSFLVWQGRSSADVRPAAATVASAPPFVSPLPAPSAHPEPPTAPLDAPPAAISAEAAPSTVASVPKSTSSASKAPSPLKKDGASRSSGKPLKASTKGFGGRD